MGPQSRSGQVRKISPPPGFDPRAVQPVASPYNDCAVPAPIGMIETYKNRTLIMMESAYHQTFLGNIFLVAGNMRLFPVRDIQ